jgi:hypothetical protein
MVTEAAGWVRNIVAENTSYEWTSPLAHFVVARPTAPGERPVVDGVWVDRHRAATELGSRPQAEAIHDMASCRGSAVDTPSPCPNHADDACC